MENWNDVLEEYSSQCLAADTMKLQIDSEELLRNSSTFYKKCIDDPGQLLKRFKVQCWKNVVGRLFEGKDERLVPKVIDRNIYMYQIVGVIIRHQILHFGPPFNVVASWVYEIMSGNLEENHIVPMIDKTMIRQQQQ